MTQGPQTPGPNAGAPAQVEVETTTTVRPGPVQIAPGRPRSARRWVLPALILGSLGLTAFALLRPQGPAATPVTVVRAETGTLLRTVTGTGTARAEVSRTVSFATSGTVTSGTVQSVQVKVGDAVRPGQLLAQLDTAAAERELASARAGVASAEADVARAQASAREARLDLARQAEQAGSGLDSAQEALAAAQRTLALQEELLGVGAVSEQDVRSARQARDEAARKLRAAQSDLSYARARGGEGGEAALTQARAGLESARVRVQNLERSLADAALRAPEAGVVSAVNVTAGNPPPAAQSAFEITDPERIYLEVPFDETRSTDLAPGQPAQVEFDALPARVIQGTVERVEPVARSSGHVASVNVRIRLSDVQAVKPGFTGSATVTTRRLRNAVTVPLEATAEEGGATRVWRVTPGEVQGGRQTGAAQPVTVTVQERNASRAAVTGVRAGDLLVTPAPADLESGELVSYPAPESPAARSGQTP